MVDFGHVLGNEICWVCIEYLVMPAEYVMSI